MSRPIDSEWGLLSLSLIVSLFKWDRPIFKRLSRNHTLSNLFSWTYGGKWDKFLSENCNWQLSTVTFWCFLFNLYFLAPSRALYVMMSLQEIVQKLWISKKGTASNVSHPFLCSWIIGSSVVPWLIMLSATRYLWRSRPLQPKMNWTCKFKQKLNNVVNEGWFCLL